MFPPRPGGGPGAVRAARGGTRRAGTPGLVSSLPRRRPVPPLCPTLHGSVGQKLHVSVQLPAKKFSSRALPGSPAFPRGKVPAAERTADEGPQSPDPPGPPHQARRTPAHRGGGCRVRPHLPGSPHQVRRARQLPPRGKPMRGTPAPLHAPPRTEMRGVIGAKKFPRQLHVSVQLFPTLPEGV